MNQNGPPPGFRLQRLEVRNWGTFDDKIHVLDPLGATALLVGENGSGKSTLVDALLTLLVPRAKRNYNVSAGGQKKRERDERSYVLGAYASESSSSETSAQTKYLRSVGSPPTILLACFANQRIEEAVSLAQILWVQDEEVKKLFLISKTQRSIANDFSGLQDSKTLRKVLRQRGFEVEDVFNDYAEKAVRYLQMESLTTLALFNQTVAIKEISHVSSFIREHMLERLDTRELVNHLEQHYENLTRCWAAIQRARQQLELLKPVVEKAAAIDEFDAKLTEVQEFREVLPACFAVKLRAMLEGAIAELERHMDALDKQIVDIDQALGKLATEQLEISQAIDNSEVGRQLAHVEEQFREVAAEEVKRRAESVEYHSALRGLDVREEVLNEASFLSRHSWALAEQLTLTETIATAATRIAEAGESLRQAKRQVDTLTVELNSLRLRPDLIPEDSRRLRDFIAHGANINAAELPFAGELMDVRERWSLEWRGALERLLRGFGLSILVPEQVYSRVNRFINDNNLRQRIVYHRVPAKVDTPFQGRNEGRVVDKMEFKQEHPLASWVQLQIANEFNHRCCETVEEFESVSRFAITKQGLIRGGGTRHIKDDSRDINDRRFHILGWRNRDKIVLLERELSETAAEGQRLATVIIEAQDSRKRAEVRLTITTKVAGFRTFAELDWRTKSEQKIALQTRRDELERSSDQIQHLRRHLEELRIKNRVLEEQKKSTITDKGGLQERCMQHGLRFSECNETLGRVDSRGIQRFQTALERELVGTEFTLANSASVQHKVEGAVTNKLIELRQKREEEAKIVLKSMERFLGQYPELKADLAADEACIPEFIRLRDAIEIDDLPRHEERFKILMSHDVLTHVASFEGALVAHRDDIEDKTRHLNEALKGIPYSSRTYIQINAVATHDPDVREFRAMLKGCFEFGLNPDTASRESAFRRISELITRFRERPEWVAKVADTRNWLTFGVAELRREDDGQENYYTDTGGRSGGQKAKLAFTILASAIAYQYRIAKDAGNPKSFRFVVVDEMFARSDEENSRYALQLFDAFQLQLLIVSPLDARARVVEPFVSSYHLTLNPTTQSSVVRTITAEEVADRLSENGKSPGAYANA
jgi:uncharacterized protein YPO0396